MISSMAHIASLASGIAPNFKLTVSFSLSAMAVIVLLLACGALTTSPEFMYQL